MKYLQSFDTKNEYKTALANGNILIPSVSIVEGGVEYIPYSKATFGDIVYYDSRDSQFKYAAAGSYNGGYKHNAYLTPIGVVAVPGRYTPDHTVRVMSLVNMSLATPSVGSAEKHAANDDVDDDINIRWGNNSQPVTGLTNLGTVNCVNPTTGTQEGMATTTTDWMRIPSDDGSWNSSAGYVDPISGYRYYYGANSGDNSYTNAPNRFGPYPLLADGSKNPLYFAQGMATNDFDGRGNTNKILAFATSKSVTWSGTTLTNDTSEGHYPAAFACDRFSTTGLAANSWYLPAEGELAFIVAKYGAINVGLNDIVSGGGRAIRLGRDRDYGHWCWSSSQTSSSNARHVNTDTGYVNNNGKASTRATNRVRAFVALSPLAL